MLYINIYIYDVLYSTAKIKTILLLLLLLLYSGRTRTRNGVEERLYETKKLRKWM